MKRRPIKWVRGADRLVDLVICDFDGVMTDNRVLLLEDGREAVFCSRSDGLAVDMMRHARLSVVILSTEHNPVVSARAAKLGVPVIQAVEDKAATVKRYCRKRGVALARTLFVGNDLNDLAALRSVGIAVCPADAHPDVRAACSVILETPGGAGVVRELVEHVLDIRFDGPRRSSGRSYRGRAGTRPKRASTKPTTTVDHPRGPTKR